MICCRERSVHRERHTSHWWWWMPMRACSMVGVGNFYLAPRTLHICRFHPYICAVPPKCSWITLFAQIVKKRDYIIVALVDETRKINRKYCDSIIVCHAARARWALRRLIRYATPDTRNCPKSPRYTFCQWWTSVYSGSTRRGLETFKSLFLYRSTKIKHPSLQKRLNINNGTSWWNIH